MAADRRPHEEVTGHLFGIGAYCLWGLAPLFWRLLNRVPLVDQLAHRTIWACLFFVLASAATGSLREVVAILRAPGPRRRIAAAAACNACNWVVFVFAVMNDHVLDASLGYFINPLVTVALGRFVLREALRPLQWIAVGLAATGVVIIAVGVGGIPWISLVLATTFGAYGLLRKTTNASALAGSTVETLILLPIAVAGLAWLQAHEGGHLAPSEPSTVVLLLCTGPVTAVPLLLFVRAARAIPLSSLGFLQYIAPTLQFLVAVFAFGEPLAPGRLAAFALVWAALLVFSIDVWSRSAIPSRS